MKISVVTPTADRPVGMALAEKMMARQYRQPDEWIVSDGGQVPARCKAGQTHLIHKSPAGAANFARNVLNGIARASGELVIFFEDDDFYFPEHISSLEIAALSKPLVGAEDKQRYYNVAARRWRIFNNLGASLCQTGLRRELLPLLEQIVQQCLRRETFGIDTAMWRSVPKEQWGIVGRMNVVGIKGLPGRAGLGVGHRPNGNEWHDDPELAKLREWIGEDANLYSGFASERTVA